MEAPSQTSETLLKAPEIARILNISRSMAYRLMQQGEIRTIHIGSARRVRYNDLQEYIRQQLSPKVFEKSR